MKILSSFALACAWLSAALRGAESPPRLAITTPMSPPTWALLERELLREEAMACQQYFAHYYDDRGYFLCVERWGGDDGPDDAIESVALWPELHMLGAPESVRLMYEKAWEGHLRQYTAAKTVEVPMARDGMYYKEFQVCFDWQHNAEGLRVFNAIGLNTPDDPRHLERLRRFAGFYLGEDPGAPNYDPEHKIIRSLFNGSRGPLLRKATALDWAGDPIDVKNRFPHLGHGENNFDQMLAHFSAYTDIVGDHPLNLMATSHVVNAYLTTGEAKYRDWVISYVDAWRERMAANGGIIPSNVGLDGKIGSGADGKWYGGTYGWAFTVKVPQTGALENRNRVPRVFPGFMNAYLLTHDDRFLESWRHQTDVINAQARVENGKKVYPHMFGDQGWYAFTPAKFEDSALQLWFCSMKPADRARTPDTPWLKFIEGNNPTWPDEALRKDLATLRQRMGKVRADETTPDTRLADDALDLSPSLVGTLMQAMLGALEPDRWGRPIFANLRYFDPVRRRAGIPEDCAALVESMTTDSVTVTLLNVNQSEPRELVVQAGGLGEHRFVAVESEGKSTDLNVRDFVVHLEPGAGAQLKFKLQRYANEPTLHFPWSRP